MKKVMLVLGIIAILVLSTSAFAADPIGGHPGVIVDTPVQGNAVAVPDAVADQLADALGDGVVVTPLGLPREGESVAAATLNAVKDNLNDSALLQNASSGAALKSVVFLPFSAELEFGSDNTAAVAFGAGKTDISNKLELASGETVKGIKNEIHLFLTNAAGDLSEEITPFEVIDGDDGVYFAFKLDRTLASLAAAARGLAESVTIQPVVVRVKPADSGNGGGGGCDAGFSGAAAMLALAGAAIMRGRARG